VLSVWGYLAGRADLMRVGIPTMIAGQFGLVAGLLLQMLSRRSTAATSPPSLAQQIHELRKASELLNAARS
jgi:hypothetical protein